MRDLIIDPQIRGWVFLSIVVITFLVDILRHYLLVIFSTQKKIGRKQLQDSQVIIRSKVLRENAGFIPRKCFLLRRNFLNNEDNGYLTQKRPPLNRNVMTDPATMADLLKGNATNVLLMIVIGGWINWKLSGFITTKVPFPLTFRYKLMLQRDIELSDLDASWVSSASWYFLNVFGLRSIYGLVLGDNNIVSQFQQMQDQMAAMPIDTKVVFKTEWEALEIIEHCWHLNDIESSIIYSENEKL